MQATCPQCSQVIAVDDSKVPPGPFMLRCPRCQQTMKMSGNEASRTSSGKQAGHDAAPDPASEVAAQTPSPKIDVAPQDPPQQAPTPRLEPTPQPPMSYGNATPSSSDGNGHRALVGLADGEQSRTISEVLQRRGYEVNTMDEGDERAIELQQGIYDVVVTHGNGQSSTSKKELVHLVNGLPPEMRSRMFLVLIGDNYKTGNTSEAFASLADFVCHPQDMAAADSALRATIAEKGRLYRAFLDVLRKKEAGDL